MAGVQSAIFFVYNVSEVSYGKEKKTQKVQFHFFFRIDFIVSDSWWDRTVISFFQSGKD